MLLWLSLVMWQCTADPLFPPVEAESGEDYLPLSFGRSWTYQIDSVIYDPLGSAQPVDTVSTYLQEVITDTFSTTAGLTFVMNQYTQTDTTLPWIYLKTIGISREQDRLLWNEENRILIKFLYPLYTGLSWDGTAFFDPYLQVPIYGELMQPFKSWSFKILGKQEQHQVGSHDWDQVLRIQQADDENLIERRFSQEWYQKNVGLVYKRMYILDTQCGGEPALCAGIPWEEKAEKGYILTQTLLKTTN
ncbi:MAG: hypothetical protein K9I85_02865 [Saprospiraceae bacterium]|nr:hypothetical protein [Saprospiraceae bacterium]